MSKGAEGFRMTPPKAQTATTPPKAQPIMTPHDAAEGAYSNNAAEGADDDYDHDGPEMDVDDDDDSLGLGYLGSIVPDANDDVSNMLLAQLGSTPIAAGTPTAFAGSPPAGRELATVRSSLPRHRGLRQVGSVESWAERGYCICCIC